MSQQTSTAPRGACASWLGEEVYAITDSQLLAPFFINVPSEADLWMFVSSRGGLTAGRVDADGALFPYMAEDRIHDARHVTGPYTLLRVLDGPHAGRCHRPFAFDEERPRRVHLYKGVTGNSLGFEEEVPELGLTFSYRWQACDALGWTRRAVLSNTGERPVAIAVLDGLRNLQPYGVPARLSQTSSCLVDAYKRSEIERASGLGIYALTSAIVDRAEASEVLRANVAWCVGLDGPRLLSLRQRPAFREGRPFAWEDEVRGERADYFATGELTLAPGASHTWWIATDAGLDHAGVVERARALAAGREPAEIERALDEATRSLRAMVASADGVQRTGDRIGDLHHFSNTLFNCMRGGVFLRDHEVPTADLRAFAAARRRTVSDVQRRFLEALPATVSTAELQEHAAATRDAALQRWCLEYLPLRFGRRHGDPSRPWNRFSIRTRDAGGNPVLQYEGNWRDIFQNWEALSLSFPDFVEGMVARFVNASTFDGFNPYRITRDGIDWEVPDPDDPWGTVGYWGDHQVAYLVRLLEQSMRTHPGRLAGQLDDAVFSYADVPYHIAPYDELVRDPWNTIRFDKERDRRIRARAARVGADGQLLTGDDGAVRHVTLAEKLLVPALSKLANLVPDGGVWMNTQRPEWNDANNALVGLGLSVVTACHLHRYLRVLRELFAAAGERVRLSAEVATWLAEEHATLEAAGPPGAGMGSAQRRALVDRLGRAFGTYRARVWEHGLSAPTSVSRGEALDFLDRAAAWVAATIRANRREDGLYHTYNLVDLADEGQLRIDRLYLMLEGQVAALGSGLVEPEEAAEIGAALFDSPLYSDAHRSFLLYPARELPRFLDRNAAAREEVEAIPLLRALVAAGDRRVLSIDRDGTGRFQGDLSNAGDLAATLDRVAEDPTWEPAVARDREAVLALFERTFRHRDFTGRSGTMYGYEGIGCVYWHMVSKLLLTLQEQLLSARQLDSPHAATLAALYERVRAGLGASKTPAEYGAFPPDPYSHTRADGRASQPGMTGQVKEGVLTRFGELGVRVDDGRVRFDPLRLRDEDFVDGALHFTFCGTPIEYVRGCGGIQLTAADGTVTDVPGRTLDREASAALLSRTGRWLGVRVGLG